MARLKRHYPISHIFLIADVGSTTAIGSTGAIFPQTKDVGLKWEVTKEADLGFDYSALAGRLTGEFDVYDKKATQALIYVYVAGTFGSQANPNSTIAPGYVLDNAATIDNKGLEFSARWHDNINWQAVLFYWRQCIL